MLRVVLAVSAAILLTAACTPRSGSNNPSGITVFEIKARDVAEIQFRHLDAVNAVRQASGLGPLTLSAELRAAAATHARDMSLQNRPWHFGSDGSTPLDRVARAGYRGQLAGENISETFENDFDTLKAWMDDPETRQTILDPNAQDFGFDWHQERNGKIWWVQVFGTRQLFDTAAGGLGN